jgi:hypothetical protein
MRQARQGRVVIGRTADSGVTTGKRPRCEAQWQCPELCCPAERCTAPATERLTFICTDGCGRATGMLLACGRCADAITALESEPPVRRSL